MAWFLYLVSLTMVAVSATYILYPEGFREKVNMLISDVNTRFLAIIPFFIGILLFVSMSWARSSGLVLILGILACLKGILLFLAPQTVSNDIIQWWCVRASVQTHRVFGLIGFAVGVTLFYQIA